MNKDLDKSFLIFVTYIILSNSVEFNGFNNLDGQTWTPLDNIEFPSAGSHTESEQLFYQDFPHICSRD